MITALFAALSAYTAAPVPQVSWEKRGAEYSMCFFPFAGALLGALWYGLCALCAFLKAPALVFACVSVCLPLLFTGGIHADGYMDVCDALSSHAPRERKLEIMKDPHAGAFAVICLAVFLLLQAAAFYALYDKGAAALYFPVFTLSRALSGILALSIKKARPAGMLGSLLKNSPKKTCVLVCALWAALSLAALYFTASLCPALFVFAVCALWSLVYALWTNKTFGGVTGDTAGFFLQICELLCAWALFLGTNI